MDDTIDIIDPGNESTCNVHNPKLLRLSSGTPYQEFFSKCLLQNEPCIIGSAASQWKCLEQWVTPGDQPDIDYLYEKYSTASVTVAQCDTKIYNVHEKTTQRFSEYVKYWKGRVENDDASHYLKDWHFTREFPNACAYRVPKFFASDWLNEYYDKHPELNDDYRFVYIGPKGTWTPLHADVFTSYSWSVNVVGEKRWVLLRPGLEDRFRDNLGNLLFDKLQDFGSEPGSIYYIVQGPGDAIFVPSGWHHQVWNSKDTISINHNWINGCNIQHMWFSMKRNLKDVEKEIQDCKDMEDWSEHCQVMLKALYGFNYQQFYEFLVNIIEARMLTLSSETPLEVYGSWKFGPNHQIFDIKRAAGILDELKTELNAKQIKKCEGVGRDPSEFCGIVKDFLENFEASN